jgi:hypothetical protein
MEIGICGKIRVTAARLNGLLKIGHCFDSLIL